MQNRIIGWDFPTTDEPQTILEGRRAIGFYDALIAETRQLLHEATASYRRVWAASLMEHLFVLQAQRTIWVDARRYAIPSPTPRRYYGKRRAN